MTELISPIHIDQGKNPRPGDPIVPEEALVETLAFLRNFNGVLQAERFTPRKIQTFNPNIRLDLDPSLIPERRSCFYIQTVNSPKDLAELKSRIRQLKPNLRIELIDYMLERGWVILDISASQDNQAKELNLYGLTENPETRKVRITDTVIKALERNENLSAVQRIENPDVFEDGLITLGATRHFDDGSLRNLTIIVTNSSEVKQLYETLAKKFKTKGNALEVLLARYGVIVLNGSEPQRDIIDALAKKLKRIFNEHVREREEDLTPGLFRFGNIPH